MIIGITGDTHNNSNIKKSALFLTKMEQSCFAYWRYILAKSLSAFKDLKCPLIAVLGNNDIEEKNGSLLQKNLHVKF